MSEYRERFLVSYSWHTEAKNGSRLFHGQLVKYQTMEEAVDGKRDFFRNPVNFCGPGTFDHDASEIHRSVYSPTTANGTQGNTDRFVDPQRVDFKAIARN